MKNRRRRRSDMGLFLGLVMLILSIILSMVIKRQATQNAYLNEKRKVMHSREAVMIQRMNLLNEAFLFSMEAAGTSLAADAFVTVQEYPEKAGHKLILYLREDACMDCHQHTLIACLERLGGKSNFILVSHSSNYYFLEEMFFMNVLAVAGQIIFYDEELYKSSNTEVRSELILAGSDLRIQAVFFPDFLADRCLSEQYYEWIEENVFEGSFEYLAREDP